jgi:hypothetical protein
MTAADAFWNQLPIWESMAANPNPDNNNADIANIVAGTIVQELGRATGGAFTRAIHEPEPVDYSWFQSFARGLGDALLLNLLDEIEAALAAPGALTLEEALAGARNRMEEIEAANPGWYRGGELTGMGVHALTGAVAPGVLATTSLGRMGIAGGIGAAQGALSGAGMATNWADAFRLGALGGALGGTLGKYTGLLPPAPGLAAGFALNYGIEQLLQSLADSD